MTATGRPKVVWKRRRLTGGAASLCLVALLAACGPAVPSPSGTPGGSSSEAPGTSPNAGPTLGPAERLASALTALQGGYTFETTLHVGAQVAARVTGRRVGDASELVIESGGASITYRIVPPGAWLQQEGGDWVEATATVPTENPLASLMTPGGVEAGPGSTAADSLVATYPASALGLAGSDPVAVTISIAPDGTVTARYETAVDGGQAVSETVLTPAPSQDPILAPSPLPSPAG